MMLTCWRSVRLIYHLLFSQISRFHVSARAHPIAAGIQKKPHTKITFISDFLAAQPCAIVAHNYVTYLNLSLSLALVYYSLRTRTYWYRRPLSFALTHKTLTHSRKNRKEADRVQIMIIKKKSWQPYRYFNRKKFIFHL